MGRVAADICKIGGRGCKGTQSTGIPGLRDTCCLASQTIGLFTMVCFVGLKKKQEKKKHTTKLKMLTGNRSKHAKVSWGRGRRPFWSPQGQPGTTAGETPHPLMSTQAEVTECAGPLGLCFSAHSPHTLEFLALPCPSRAHLLPSPAGVLCTWLLTQGQSSLSSSPCSPCFRQSSPCRPAAEARASLARLLAAAAAAPSRDWQRKAEAGCRRARASSSAGWLSCLSFPRCGGQLQDVQGSEVPASGSWAGAGAG